MTATDNRDTRDADTIGKIIISRPTNMTACQAADLALKGGAKNGSQRDS